LDEFSIVKNNILLQSSDEEEKKEIGKINENINIHFDKKENTKPSISITKV
jgi:hypothetical protein